MNKNEFQSLIDTTLDRNIRSKEEITSLEMVIILNELNDYSSKTLDIFDLIECEHLEDIYDLYFKA